LPGADSFDVLANPAAAEITNAPFTLATANASPQGIAIPVLNSPLPATGYLAFISQQNANNLAIIDDKPAPAADTNSPLTLAGTAPFEIASVPAPQ
jgi:hypothetical protein